MTSAEEEDEFEGLPPIHRAINLGDYAGVIRIIHQDPDALRAVAYPEVPDLPVHVAAGYGHLTILAFLLDRGADIEARGHNGYTPLHAAARNGKIGAVGLLLARNANLEARDTDGYTPLLIAGGGREPECEDIGKLLLRCGARLDLNAAVRLGYWEQSRTILKADPEAVRNAPLPAILLTDAVISIKAKLMAHEQASGDESELPIEVADELIATDLDILDYLIAGGAPKDGIDRALFYSVQMPSISVSERLLTYGADAVPERDRPGLAMAATNSRRSADMIALLKHHGLIRLKP